jgi:hypothetical protein
MTRKKKKDRAAASSEERVVGMAWFRKEDWPKLLEVSADPDQLEKTHQEWLEFALASIIDLRAKGLRVEKVDVGVDELVAWCQARGVPVDGKARADFAAFKLRKRHEKS